MPEEPVALQQRTESLRVSRCGSTQQCESITFAEASRLYEKAGGDDRFLPLAKQHLGSLLLWQITQEAIDQLAPGSYPDARASTIVRQWYGPIAAVLHFAASQGLCEYRRIRLPRLPPASRLRWIWPADSLWLTEACSPHFQRMYRFLQHTGAWPSETIILDWRQIDLSRHEVEFPSSAAAEGRIVHLQPVVASALEILPHRRGAVFRRPDGEPYKRTRRAANAVKTAFAAACRRSGIADFTLRDVRTTACLWHYAINRDLDALMVRSGCRDHRAIARYKHVPVADLEALRAALREQQWDTALAGEGAGRS
jgi:integrase